MSLKKAKFTYTKENAETVERVATIKKVVFHYDEMAVETIYDLFPNEEAKAKGAIAKLVTQKVAVDLNNPADLALVLSSSDRIWEINMDAPFIVDFSETDGEGKMVRNLKSLNELGAAIEEVN